MSGAPDLVLLGNLLVDDIVLDNGTTLMAEPGGAMLYMSLAARLWDVSVGVVSVAGSDYPRAALEALVARGVDLSGVRDYGKPGVRSWLLYEAAGRQIIHRLDAAPHAEVSPAPQDIPEAWRKAKAFHVAPMPLECQRRIVASLPREAFVSCDPHVPVTRDTAERWRDLFDHVDAFMPSEIELDLHDSPEIAMRRLEGDRLSWVFLKRGAAGGLILDRRNDRVTGWPTRAEHVVDTTGAGDGFAGGFLAGWITHGDLQRSIEQGVVSASFAIEEWGAQRIMGTTPDDAASRHKDWYEGSRSLIDDQR